MSERSFAEVDQLRRISRAKASSPAAPQALGEEMIEFFRRSVS
jgi:hypothetical protein